MFAENDPNAAPNDPSQLAAALLEFGAPLLADLPADTPLEAVRAACTLVITMWNAHVMAHAAWGHPEHLAELESLVYGDHAPREIRATYRVLTERRHDLFADDVRAVGEWEVLADAKQGFTLRCEQRWPDDASDMHMQE